MPGFFLIGAALFVVFAGFGFFEVGINALASKLFQKKAALLMNLLHSFYGLGAVIGPKAAGLITGRTQLGWRYIYMLSLPLALALLLPSIFLRFPEENPQAGKTQAIDGSAPGRKSFFDALRSPVVWLMSIALGLGVAVEMSSSNWGAMYFWDVYGLNPSIDGATFLSAFFLAFTVSRLVCGLFVERIGYMRSIQGSAFIVLAIFIAGFFFGSRGIYVLPALGFFVAQFWPIMMAVAIVSFGKDAPVYSSAVIALSGLFNAAIQYLVGLTNKFFGPAWGYRSSIVYTVLLIIILFILSNKLKNAKK
jgi:fucose permease